MNKWLLYRLIQLSERNKLTSQLLEDILYHSEDVAGWNTFGILGSPRVAYGIGAKVVDGKVVIGIGLVKDTAGATVPIVVEEAEVVGNTIDAVSVKATIDHLLDRMMTKGLITDDVVADAVKLTDDSYWMGLKDPQHGFLVSIGSAVKRYNKEHPNARVVANVVQGKGEPAAPEVPGEVVQQTLRYESVDAVVNKLLNGLHRRASNG